MGYMSIYNLYKDKTILLFKECYALEKIHGSSSNLTIGNEFAEPDIKFHSGGASHNAFSAIFNQEELKSKWKEHNYDPICIYGEVYGGKMQGMSKTYGPNLKFVVFDIMMDGKFLTVDQAERITKNLGLEFVDYVKISTDLETIDKERDKPSVQAIRNGMGNDKQREGVVLRPLVEMSYNGERIICKHKQDSFMETATPRKVEINVNDLDVLHKAEEIANEWVTEMRLEHVLDKLPENAINGNLKVIMDSMVEDVVREAKGEIVDSQEARKTIGRKTLELIKKKRQEHLLEPVS